MAGVRFTELQSRPMAFLDFSLLPISERALVAGVCYRGQAAGGCREETAVLLDPMS